MKESQGFLGRKQEEARIFPLRMFHGLKYECFEQSSVINGLMKSFLKEEDRKHHLLQSTSLQRLHTPKLGYKNRFSNIYTAILGNSA